MLSLGIVASAYNPPATLPSGPLAGAYLTSAGDAADATSHTFTDQNIGAEDATRFIVAVVTSRKASPGAVLSSVTIGGVTATIATTATNDGNTVGIAYALVPTGATATVVTTWGSTVLRSGLGLWRITGGGLTVTTNTATGAGPTISAGITGATDGFIVAGSGGSGVTTYTWTDVTERYDAAVESFTHSGADAITVGATTVSLTTATNNSSPVLAVAAFAPTA